MILSWFTKEVKECNVIFSAGGIRTVAQIGALKALEREGWKIRNICGISAGSIVASLYAAGLPLDQIEQLAITTDFSRFQHLNFPCLHKGLFKFDGLGKWVADQCLPNALTKARCTLYIGACSLSTGRRFIFKDPWSYSELPAAIEATCTIPTIFEPKKYHEDYLADGALWSSAPVHFFSDKVSEAYNPLPTFVINVQNSHQHVFTNFSNPVKVLYRVFEVFQINRLRSLRKRIQANKYSKVCMIELENVKLSPFAFKASAQAKKAVIDAGEQATIQALEGGRFDG